MPTLAVIAFFVLGVVLVIKGGDWFVTASVALAAHAQVPRILIGSTLVSLATTSPELAVSVTASLHGNPGLAIGNAVGSVICNIGLIIGVLCVLRPLPVRARDFRFACFYMLGSGILLTALTIPLRIGRPSGALLLTCAGVYLLADFWRHFQCRGTESAAVAATETPRLSVARSVGLFGIGALLVIVGSRLLADNGVILAELAGVPPMVIGLTLVALGTSLPELVTAITAARKGVPELSLGNVIGANIMNITLVTGSSASIAPLTMTRITHLYNFPAMLVMCALLLILARTGRRLTRHEGWVFLGAYVVYVVGLFSIGE